jgi:hypothetical protein
VTEYARNLVKRFTPDGSFLGAWPVASPAFIDADGQDNVYVTTGPANNIYKFTGLGVELRQIRGGDPVDLDVVGDSTVWIANNYPGYVCKHTTDLVSEHCWGRFEGVVGLAAGLDGSVCLYTSDTMYGSWAEIVRLDASGSVISRWGSRGSADGQFSGVSGLCVGPDGNLYVTDRGNHRIQVFTLDGVLLGKWGAPPGLGADKFWPSDIAFDSLGNMYVTNSSPPRVFVYAFPPPEFAVIGVLPTSGGIGSGSPPAVSATFNLDLDGLPADDRVAVLAAPGAYHTRWLTLPQPDVLALALNPEPSSGELLQVVLRDGIQDLYSRSLQVPYTWRFRWPVRASIPFQGSRLVLEHSQKPSYVSATDVNGDGYLDAIVALSSADGIAVMRSVGDGAFVPGGVFPAGDAPMAVEPIDANGDGHPDLVTANSTSGDASILLNDGAGKFLAPTSIPVGRTANRVRVADLNGDGWQDFVVSVFGDATRPSGWAVVFSNGDGSFGTATFDTVSAQVSGLEIVEANNDGRLDVALTTLNPNELRVFLNDGHGVFHAGQVLSLAYRVDGLGAGDLDADGWEDLAGVGIGPGGKSIIFKNAAGAYSPAKTKSLGDGGTHVTVGDLDGSGNLDIVVAAESPTPAIWAWLNPASADSSVISRELSIAWPAEARNVALVGIDPDGHLEALVAYRSGRVCYVTSAEEPDTTHPASRLLQNFPNPFNETTRITVMAATAMAVDLEVFSITGRAVRRARGLQLRSGANEVQLSREGLPAGVYFYRVVGDGFSETRKMIVVQ